MDSDFIFHETSNLYPDFFDVNIKSPSNIALIKYWGKKENQIPSNPSVSFTLDKCVTKSRISFIKSNSYLTTLDLFFEGKKNEEFKKKIDNFISKILVYCPYLRYYNIEIKTENSFPHSSGIASSASSMSAFALGVMSLEKEIKKDVKDDFFIKKSSFLARLGSGSACRSILGNVMIWGKTKSVKNSSDLFAINPDFEIHHNFKNFQDTILIIDKTEKEVSSSLGHSLMSNHPFAESRFVQANRNLKKIIECLKNGDLENFGKIVEIEALTLHSMMMTSDPHFILMKANTLKAIEKIWNFRKKENLNVYFTLDAGANIHVLYPDNEREKILPFIEDELLCLCRDREYIKDRLGNGYMVL